MSTHTPEALGATIERLYECERTKNLAEWEKLWAPDAVLAFPHDREPGGRDLRGRDALVAATGQKFIERAWTDIDAEVAPLADGRRVFVRLHVGLHFENGTVISGPLLMLFTFNDEGLIVLAEEYVNEAQWPTNYKDLATEDAAQS